ncbi:magnesium/cobalt transporter CorA [Candidatus Micrarchaeota archaeon]|nr:magnesium/cobalt transporter CorA [Candidatus Micrarchaeota archaeon]
MRTLLVQNAAVTSVTQYDRLAPFVTDQKARLWIDISDPKKEDLEFLEKTLGVHPLVLEDVSNQRQRPKMEPYDNCLYLVLKTVDPQNGKASAQLNLLLSNNYLVTIHHGPMGFLDGIWQRTEKTPANLARGPDFTLYTLLDTFVDNLAPAVTEFDLQIDSIEEKVFKDPNPAVIAKLFGLKRKIFYTRRAVAPLRDVLTSLSRHDTPFVNKKNTVYFRDVYDHTVRITESLDNAREILTAAVEVYVSSISNNLNTVMKRLTAITAIIMVPSLVAGVYGMNFGNITDYAFGETKFVFLAMAASVFLLGGYFRWRGWL